MPKGVYLRTKKIRLAMSLSRLGKKRPNLVANKQWHENMSKSKTGKTGELNNNWKGEKATYGRKHRWIEKVKGKPMKCEHCGTTEKTQYDWANKDHRYSRNPDDYMRLCAKCHVQYDKKFLGRISGFKSRKNNSNGKDTTN